MTEERKYAILFSATILAARKPSQKQLFLGRHRPAQSAATTQGLTGAVLAGFLGKRAKKAT